MAKRKQSFVKTTLFGGLVVILPVVLLILIFSWIWRWITRLIAPLASFLTAKSQLQGIYASLIALTLLILICFLIGLIVRTRVGAFFHRELERRFFKIAPGYNLLREIVNQIFGKRDHPFMQAALVDPFNSDCWMTGLITDSYQDKMYTVFVPSGLNPTTGLVFHLPAARVKKLQIPLEEAMRTIIACGAGSSEFLKILLKEKIDE